MLEVEFGEHSDPGRARQINEDRLGYITPANAERSRTHGWLFALADGVGGQLFGERAAAGAIETALAMFHNASAGAPHAGLLQDIVQAANTRVFEMGRESGAASGAMATTLVLCALRFDRAVIAHVGDSRCYLIRDGLVLPLTRDHSLANEQMRLGILSARQAALSANRRVLTKSIGSDLFVSADFNEQQLLPDDLFLLCSDGIHGCIEESEMPFIIERSGNLDQASKDFVNIANERDGSDNVSIQLIRIRDVERMGMYRGRLYKLP